MHHDPYRRLYGEKESNAILESIDLRSSIKFQTFAAFRSLELWMKSLLLTSKKLYGTKGKFLIANHFIRGIFDLTTSFCFDTRSLLRNGIHTHTTA